MAEIFRRAGVNLERGSDDRINGWAALRAWMSVRDFTPHEGPAFRSPALLVHPSCLRFIRTVSTLVADTKDQEDVESTPDEHPSAAMRRLVMSRPMPSPNEKPPLPPEAIGHDIEKLREAARTSGRV